MRQILPRKVRSPNASSDTSANWLVLTHGAMRSGTSIRIRMGSILTIVKIGLGPAHVGRGLDVDDPILFVLESQALEGLAKLRLVLRQHVALLFVGNLDQDLALLHGIAEVRADLDHAPVNLRADGDFFVRE